MRHRRLSLEGGKALCAAVARFNREAFETSHNDAINRACVSINRRQQAASSRGQWWGGVLLLRRTGHPSIEDGDEAPHQYLEQILGGNIKLMIAAETDAARAQPRRGRRDRRIGTCGEEKKKEWRKWRKRINDY